MALEETRQTSQAQPGGDGGASSQAGQGETPQFLTPADLQRFKEAELPSLLQQALERGRQEGQRDMQSRKDQEIAERERRHQERLEAQQGLYDSTLKQMGAGEEDLQQLQSAFEGRVQEMDRDAELAYYRQTTQEQRAYEDTNRRIDAILAAAGVPRDHPALDMTSEEAFLASVKKAKEQMWQQVQGATEPGAPETPQAQTEKLAASAQPTRGQRGAADVLGGGAGVYTPTNPIADIKDPKELLKMGVEKAKPKLRR